MSRTRVLLAGASGQLGAMVARTFADADLMAHTHATLDIADPDAVRRTVHELQPSVIINCAAFNDVDGAESRPAEALAVNAFALRSLARAAQDVGATLVHYSTDFVFDGDASEPYTEDVTPAPRSAYGASKLLGEWFALEAPRAFVLRVESLFGSPADWQGRRGTLDGIVAGLESGRVVKVFTDRVVTPAYTPDIADATRFLVESTAPSGVYHCVNSGMGTWQQVASEAAAVLGIAARLEPITMDQFPTKAARPRFCALSNRKLAAAGFALSSWQDALRRWLTARAVGAAGA